MYESICGLDVQFSQHGFQLLFKVGSSHKAANLKKRILTQME